VGYSLGSVMVQEHVKKSRLTGKNDLRKTYRAPTLERYGNVATVTGSNKDASLPDAMTGLNDGAMLPKPQVGSF